MAKHKHTQAPTQAPAQPAQATPPAPATPVSAAPTNAALAVVYTVGKAYNVRNGTAQDNARSWDALQKVLTAGNGQATRADLEAAVTPFNHKPFVQYAIRRGWLAEVKATAAA